MSSILINQLFALGNSFLERGIYENATFYLEKLFYENDNETTRYLLAKSYIGETKYHKAYYILKDQNSSNCRCLHAEVCMKMNKFHEAEKALLTERFLKMNVLSKDIEDIIPSGSYGYYLLGNQRSQDAISLYRKSLEMDPFMWCSFEKLNKLQPETLHVGKYFSEINPKILMFNNNFSSNFQNCEPNDFSLSPDNPGVYARIKHSENNNNIINKINIESFNQKNVKNENMNNSFNNNNSGNINVNLNNQNNQANVTSNNNNKNINMNLFNWTNTNSGKNNLNSGSQYNNNNFSSSGVEKFQITKNEDSEYNSSCLSNANSKYQAEFRVFTENSEQQKQINTPVLNKDKLEDDDDDYSYLNNHHFNFNEKYKQCNLKPFNFSGSPNPIGQDLNKIICNSELMKKYNISNNIQSANNGNKDGIINNDQMKEKFMNGTIKPFNFNVNNHKSGNNFNTEEDIIQIKENDSEYLSVTNEDRNNQFNNNPQSNNIFQNINLSGNDQNLINTQNSNMNKKKSNVPNFAIGNFDSKIKSLETNNFKSINNTNTSIFDTSLIKGNVTYETYKSIINSGSKPEKVNSYSNKSIESFRDVGHMLKVFGEIIKKLSLYKCQEALNLIELLPNNQKNSGLVLSFIGRAFFEMNKYKESEKYYKESLKVEPYRLEGVEYFSSCLWHLRDQYQLCNLANHALEQSLFSPETWVVLGNCYSLQKEHEVALKFLSRAIQLNNSFAYAYTLCGHEHFANEAFNESKNYYSTAIAIDDKHLNAWWGLSNILMKEEDFKMAITYLKRALIINKNSANLTSMLANAYLQVKDINRALATLEEAEKIDSANHLVKYQKANILFLLRKYDESLKILLDLKEKVPKEAPIYILIGHIYKAKDDFKSALYHYNQAIDLDNKDYNSAKASIEKLMMDSEHTE